MKLRCSENVQGGPKKRYPGINWVNVVWFNGFNRLRGLIWAE